MLRATFLGGADEIGASCVLIEAAGRRLLVDAGIPLGAAEPVRVPYLAALEAAGTVDAVVVTHAHLDHGGALPLVAAASPGAPVFATEPTVSLLRVLLLDAAGPEEPGVDPDQEIPRHPRPAVEALLCRTTGVPFLSPVDLCDGAVRATFYPSGHVLGAAAVALETDEGTVLVTGDLSIANQHTVSGMVRLRVRPDLLVCESTYGDRANVSRRAEEERLAQATLETLAAGGSVLVPVHALGRAQEALLVMRRALARPGAPAATVHADGAVRAVCDVYSRHADALAPFVRERAAEGRSVFYTADGRVTPVASPEERAALLDGGPRVVVASSGTLAGGPSAFYARRLAGRQDALVVLTSRQDEEAPGRQLQEVASGARSTLRLGEDEVEVRCRVETYGLSSHADGSELAALVDSLRPSAVALVHGAGPAREALGRALSDRGIEAVHLPAAGETLEVPRARPAARPRLPGIAEGRPLDAEALAELRDRVIEARGGLPRRPYSAYDLAEEWLGTEGVPADLGPVRALLDASPHVVEADRRRPYLYRFVEPGAVPPEPQGRWPGAAGRLEQNAALSLAYEILGPDAGVTKRGVDRRDWVIRLSFLFPEVAAGKYRAEMAELAERSGWRVEVNYEPNIAALSDAALEALPPGTRSTRRPSIRGDSKLVVVTVDRQLEAEAAAAAVARFAERTGYALEIAVATAAPVAPSTFDGTGRMEVNAAFAEVDRAFADQPHRPYKKSKKSRPEGESMELAFVSPAVGARYEALIAELSRRTGWPMAVAAKVEQQTVLRVARSLLPETWSVTRGPGVDLDKTRVRLRLASPPEDPDLARVRAALIEATGFDLEVV